MSKPFNLVDRVGFIKKVCQGKKVLHLGCTNYPYTDEAIELDMLLHFDLDKISDQIYGFDFDQRGLDILSKHGSENLYQADVEKLEDVGLNETFDVIIAGEMIEHLNNPGLFLQGIKRFMNDKTELVITTINAYCAMRFAMYAISGRGGENEPVHPDHVTYYSYKTLKLVVERSDLKLKEFCFYDIGQEHKAYGRWIYHFINDVSVKISPQLSDGVIAVCQLK